MLLGIPPRRFAVVLSGGALVTAVVLALGGCASSSVASSARPTAFPTAAATPGAHRTPAQTLKTPVGKKGSLKKVTPQVVNTLKPVSPNATVSVDSKVTVSVTSKSITSNGLGAGNIKGPAVLVSVRVTNQTSKSVDLGHVSVTMLDKSKAPAPSADDTRASRLHGTLAPGKSTTGKYVLNVSKSGRDGAWLYISFAAGVPTAVFHGDF